MRKKINGFTLVELIIVIAVLAIFVGLLAPNVVRFMEKGKKSKCFSSIDTIQNDFFYAYVLESGSGDVDTNKVFKEVIDGHSNLLYDETNKTISGGCESDGVWIVSFVDNLMFINCSKHSKTDELKTIDAAIAITIWKNLNFTYSTMDEYFNSRGNGSTIDSEVPDNGKFSGMGAKMREILTSGGFDEKNTSFRIKKIGNGSTKYQVEIIISMENVSKVTDETHQITAYKTTLNYNNGKYDTSNIMAEEIKVKSVLNSETETDKDKIFRVIKEI